MGNWLKKIKCRPRRRGKYERNQSSVINHEMFKQAQSTIRKGDRHFYKLHIVPCAKCGRKFKMNKQLKKALEYHEQLKYCPVCRGRYSKRYLMVSKTQEIAIERLHEAQDCTVRKMTKEEREKYCK